MGQPVGTLVQIPVRQGGIAHGHRDRVRRGGGPLGDDLVDTARVLLRRLTGCRRPVEQGADVVRPEHVQCAGPAAGVGGHRCQQALEAGGQR